MNPLTHLCYLISITAGWHPQDATLSHNTLLLYGMYNTQIWKCALFASPPMARRKRWRTWVLRPTKFPLLPETTNPKTKRIICPACGRTDKSGETGLPGCNFLLGSMAITLVMKSHFVQRSITELLDVRFFDNDDEPRNGALDRIECRHLSLMTKTNWPRYLVH